MISFCGYNFCKDGNSLDPVPTNITKITSSQISNAIFDNFYITKDITSAYSANVPTDWDFNTILLANFNGTLSAGNINTLLSQITSIRIKRRKIGEFDWITLVEKPVTIADDLTFIFEDYLARQDTEYEYAWVPVLNDIEGDYVTKTILSQFQGVYITDADTIYKFYAGVSYGDSVQVQKIGTFEPIGRQYPVYVSNALTNYQTGSMSGKIMGQYGITHEFNRKEMVEEKDNLLKFLTNKKAKIIKDWNGNEWLVMIVGSPSVTYDSNWGMGMMDIGINYSECGSPDSKTDLQNVGMIPTLESGV